MRVRVESKVPSVRTASAWHGFERGRDAALSRYRHDRDSAALDHAMARLDREQADAMAVGEERGVSPERAVAWLRELGSGWRALEESAGAERRDLAEAIFESLEVHGFRTLRLRLTPAAVAHGFADLLPEPFVIPARGIVGNGRGESGCASRTQPSPTFRLINCSPAGLPALVRGEESA